MKIGIDSYCYHRFMGEVYPDQEQPPKKMTMEDFLKRAKELDVDGVMVDPLFMPSKDPSYLREIKALADGYGFDRIYDWGHPDGLERGKNPEKFKEMLREIPLAKIIGADIIHVVGSSLMFRHEPHQPQIKALAKLFKEAVKVARDNDIKMAVENHIDFTADEMLQLLEEVDSEYLGINFDTGNFLRLLDDPVKGMEKLAPYVLATHVKDLMPDRNVSPHEWYFFATVPVGKGIVDNDKLAAILHKAGFSGFLAVEMDHPHTDWVNREDEAVELSVAELRRIANKYK